MEEVFVGREKDYYHEIALYKEVSNSAVALCMVYLTNVITPIESVLQGKLRYKDLHQGDPDRYIPSY